MEYLTGDQHDDLRILLDSPFTPEQQIKEISDLLTKEQIKQLAEDAGMYCGEWVEFDKNDKSTWPDDKQPIIFQNKTRPFPKACTFSYRDQIHWDDGFGFGETEVKHWACLPKPKEN